MTSPPETDTHEITGLLERWRAGDDAARQSLLAKLYPVMRAVAQKELGGMLQRRSTLRATDLAHEAYLRLLDQRNPGGNRGHFLAIVARVIRRVAVDLVRQRLAEKRGSQVEFVVLERTDDEPHANTNEELDLLSLDQALELLEKREPVAAQIMELRYFSGMTNDEVAEHLGIGVATVVRHWQFGRAFLYRRLTVS
jgi:RNA polymerase sigma factor (TIGR02999 family)